MRIAILTLDGVFDSGLSVLLDTFSTANELAALQGARRAPITVSAIGVRRRVRTAHGLTLTTEVAPTLPRVDWVVVPALNAKLPELLERALSRTDVREAVGLLRTWSNAGVKIAAACGGTFLLGEAGVLDGQHATTTWSLASMFRKRYSTVKLDDKRMVVPSGAVVTAGAAMAHLDLALWMVRQRSPELAQRVASFLLIDKRSSQATYMIQDHLSQADPLIARFDCWVRDNLARGFSIQEAADALSVGPRTLHRRLEAVLGKTPLTFVQDLRVEHALHLTSLGYGLEDIATEVGYANSATLRTLLRRKLGRGVRELKDEMRSERAP